jgi:hypothetical protein
MTTRHATRFWLQLVVLASATLAASSPALAQVTTPASEPATAPAAPPAEDKAPNTGRISLSAGVDYTTHYYFRGILQEDQDWIVQPYAEVTFKLYQGEGALSSVFATLGIWNSLHGGPTGVDGGALSQDPKAWYEVDLYGKLGVTLFDKLAAAFFYTAYISPNDRFKTVEEVGLSLAYNDAALLGPFALNPTVALAFEIDGQADAGRSKGTYLQLGVAPGVALFENSRVPVALSFPLTLGLSLDDYYEFGSGDDDAFGYASGGVTAAVPLKFIPPGFGSWTAKAGVQFMTLGDNLERVNNGERFEVIGTFGLSFTY